MVCNDLAAMGAEPLGVLATLLFPAGVLPSRLPHWSPRSTPPRAS